MARKKIIKYFSAITIILMIALILYIFLFSDNEKTQITRDSEVITINTFHMEGTGEITLPYSVRVKKGEVIALKFTIPDQVTKHYALTFRSLYFDNELYVDGVLAGSYGGVLPLPIGRMVGNIRVIIPVDESMAGKEATLYVTPYYNQSMDLSSVQIGYIDDLKLAVLYDNVVRIVVCIIMFTIWLLAMGLMAYQIIVKSNWGVRLLMYFSAFDMLVITWIICSSDIPQFFTSCNEGVSMISFLALAVMVIPYMGYCEQVLHEGQKYFTILRIVGWFIPLANVICFAFNVCDPYEILIATHIYMILGISLSFYFAIKEWKNNLASKILASSMIVLIVAACVGLVCFYVSPTKGYDATAFGIGFVIFVFALFGLILYLQVGYIEERKFMDTYKKMAYTDVLTGIGNRTAFEQKFSEIHENNLSDTYVTLIMFDLNRLKYTNDNFGHQAGDEIIIGMGECLRKTFGAHGNCYRLGGDEYAVVLIDKQNLTKSLLDEFNECLEKYNKNHTYKISTAIGYAEIPCVAGKTFFRDVYCKADKQMYEDKERTKHGGLDNKH